MIIETERLVLRPLEDADFEDFAAMNADKETMRFFPAPLTKKQSKIVFERYQNALQTDGFALLAAELERTGKFGGVVGLARMSDQLRAEIPGNPEVEVGWRFCRQYWGQGLAPEGAAACIQYGFEVLNLPEIVAITAIQNLPSRRVMEKLNMTHRADKNFWHPSVPPECGLQEHVLYGLENPGAAA